MGRGWRWPVVAAGVAFGCGPGSACPEVAVDDAVEAPNVLLVVLDDVGLDQVAAWEGGPDAAPTPTVDCLCERGLRFQQVWAHAFCSPSRAQMQTGRLSVRNGVGHNVRDGEQLPLAEVTLGEVARSAGYTTGLFGKWHLGGFTSPSGALGPNLQGYDRFAGAMGNLVAGLDDVPTRALGYERWFEVVDGAVTPSGAYPTTLTVERVLDFVDDTPEPWLAVASFNAPHDPFHTPPASLRDGPPQHGVRGQYRDMLTATDRELGRLLEGLPADVYARTVVIVVADNGTHRPVISAPFAPDRHKGTMFEGGLRVPMVIAGPGVAQGAATDALTHVVDLLPTVADLVGAALPDVELDGRSLLAQLVDPSAPGHDVLVDTLYGADGAQSGVRDDTYKLIRADGVQALYRLSGPSHLEGPDDLLADGVDDEEAAAVARLAGRLDAIPAPPPGQ